MEVTWTIRGWKGHYQEKNEGANSVINNLTSW